MLRFGNYKNKNKLDMEYGLGSIFIICSNSEGLSNAALDAYGGAASTTRGLLSGIFPAVPANNIIEFIYVLLFAKITIDSGDVHFDFCKLIEKFWTLIS